MKPKRLRFPPSGGRPRYLCRQVFGGCSFSGAGDGRGQRTFANATQMRTRPSLPSLILASHASTSAMRSFGGWLATGVAAWCYPPVRERLWLPCSPFVNRRPDHSHWRDSGAAPGRIHPMPLTGVTPGKDLQDGQDFRMHRIHRVPSPMQLLSFSEGTGNA